MKVKDLLDELAGIPENTEIVMSIGNAIHRPLHEVHTDSRMIVEDQYIEVLQPGDEGDDYDYDDLQHCIVLWPA